MPSIFQPLCVLAIVALTLPGGAEAGAGGGPRFRFLMLPTLPDVHSTVATAINENGVTVGMISHGIFLESAVWTDPRKEPTIITGKGSAFAMPRDVNAAGQVVGSAGEGIFAFSWHAGGDLDFLPMDGPCCPDAGGINDQGVIAGFVFFLDILQTHACLWQGGRAIDLGVVPGDIFSMATDISESGHVVGQSNNRAAMWFNGAVIALEPSMRNLSMAYGVNNRGEAVGEAPAAGPIAWSRPRLWRGGRGIELPLLGGNFGVARSINDQSWIVGYAQAMPAPGDLNIRATLWIDEQPHDLHSLIVNLPADARLDNAADINNAGQIVGDGHDSLGNYFAFRLDPIVPTDLNADGAVNGVDLGILLSQWNRAGSADLNGDGAVNGVDLGILLAAWSK